MSDRRDVSEDVWVRIFMVVMPTVFSGMSAAFFLVWVATSILSVPDGPALTLAWMTGVGAVLSWGNSRVMRRLVRAVEAPRDADAMP